MKIIGINRDSPNSITFFTGKSPARGGYYHDITNNNDIYTDIADLAERLFPAELRNVTKSYSKPRLVHGGENYGDISVSSKSAKYHPLSYPDVGLTSPFDEETGTAYPYFTSNTTRVVRRSDTDSSEDWFTSSFEGESMSYGTYGSSYYFTTQGLVSHSGTVSDEYNTDNSCFVISFCVG